MSNKLTKTIASVGLSLLACSVSYAQNAYFQSPDMHQNEVVFTSQGDLWLADATSNMPARRLTSHTGIETGAKFSPNGESVAFVASYNGSPDVFMIATDGSVAKQVSFELGRIKLVGWVDGKHILISTNTDTGMHGSYVLKKINVDTLSTEELPVSDAIEGVISKDGKSLFFVQHGLQSSTDNANHYKGGATGELWKFDLKSRRSNKEATQLSANHDGSIHTPMFFNNGNNSRVFFVSNEKDIDNLWSMKADGSDLTQHTKFTDWAVRDASLDGDKIIFQHGADLKVFNITNGGVSSLAPSLQSDFVDLRTKYINKPLRYISGVSIGNKGEKAAVVTRGRLGVLKTDDRRAVNVVSDPASRIRSAVLSNDGSTIYAISDQSGDYEVWSYDADGKSNSKQLTKNANGLKTNLWLSPDGKTLAYTQKKGGLFLLDIASNKVSRIAKDVLHRSSDLSFSSDSRYLAVTFLPVSAQRSQILVYDTKTKESAVATSAKFASYSPSFSDKLDFLYFISDRSFTPSPAHPWGDRNTGSAFNKRGQVFAIALQEDAKFPFLPKTELEKKEEKPDDKDDKKDKKDKDSDAKESATIQFKGLAQRQWQVDVPAANYRSLVANNKGLFLLEENTLKGLAFKHKAKLKTINAGVTGVAFSDNKKHILLAKGRGESTKLYSIKAGLTPPSKLDDSMFASNSFKLQITPQLEWQQLFKDAWLMHRDSFFDPNMRGLDWEATKKKYMPLLSRVNERSELNDVFQQMMGELNSLHSQVRGGDIQRAPNSPRKVTLGAQLVDTKQGVKIATIFAHDPDILSQASPLAKPEVDAENGDIIVAVNNQAVKNVAELNQALLNTQGQQVLLSLKRGKKAHDTIVVPQSSGRMGRYRYQHWVNSNQDKVAKANDDIGYLHLYSMTSSDLVSFVRDFYAQNHKKGLIIDVRRNRGGNIDSIIIEKLLRQAWSFWQYADGSIGTNMQNAFRGHLVVLADQFTYSDGESFTAGVKALKLGKVIGKQTAGAGVWLTSSNRLTDGGIARAAEFPVYAMDGRWITEGRGISPDIDVSNLPHATYNGKDAQLEAAIKYLEDEIKQRPIKELKPMPFPPVQDYADDIK